MVAPAVEYRVQDGQVQRGHQKQEVGRYRTGHERAGDQDAVNRRPATARSRRADEHAQGQIYRCGPQTDGGGDGHPTDDHTGDRLAVDERVAEARRGTVLADAVGLHVSAHYQPAEPVGQLGEARLVEVEAGVDVGNLLRGAPDSADRRGRVAG